MMIARGFRPIGLPLELSSFIGREAEISYLAPLVLQHRLVTLTGSGGAGKSRLAFRVARNLESKFPDGVHAVELASLDDPGLIASAVAQALGLAETADAPLLDRLVAHFEAREFLLVLDNCEHLIEGAAAFVEALLRRCCTDLHIFVTSREPLGVPGEIAWRVPPLSAPPSVPEAARPDQHDAPQLESLGIESFDAVRLFVDRAREADPGFTLTPVTGPSVAAICGRLDGMPLAIELAAARVKVLTPMQIEARLEGALGLLSGGGRGAPPRHRTIRATIEWSYRLLDQTTAAVLQRLAVFNGGCTVEAAAAVCRDVVSDSDRMLDILTQLVDKSLLVAHAAAGEMRYHLLETIRQFALERLAEADRAETARERHLGFYLALTEHARPEMRSKKLLFWLERFDLELDNFRAALRFSVENAESSQVFAEQSLRLATALEIYWRKRGHFAEGRTWLARALAAPAPSERPELRAHALTAAANLAWFHQEGRPAVLPLIEQSIAFWRAYRPQNPKALADALKILALLHWSLGDDTPARSLLNECLDLYRRAEDELGVADTLYLMGKSYLKDDPEVLRELLGQAAAIYDRYGDLTEGQPRNWLAYVLVQAGDYDAAQRLFKQSLAESSALRDRFGMMSDLQRLCWLARLAGNTEEAWTYAVEASELSREIGVQSGDDPLHLAHVMLLRGNDRDALPLFLEGIELFRRASDERAVASCLDGLASLECARGEPRKAAMLLAASDALCDRAGGGAYWFDKPDRERCLNAIRDKLEPAAIAVAWAEGARLTLDGAVDLVLQSTEPGSPTPRPARTTLKAIKAQFGGLTAREREVAACVARDLSNREIADELVVTERTVEAHVANILSKLEFTSRRQIAKWAVEKKLVRAE